MCQIWLRYLKLLLSYSDLKLMAAAILDFTRLFLTVQVLTALQYLSGTYG